MLTQFTIQCIHLFQSAMEKFHMAPSKKDSAHNAMDLFLQTHDSRFPLHSHLLLDLRPKLLLPQVKVTLSRQFAASALWVEAPIFVRLPCLRPTSSSRECVLGARKQGELGRLVRCFGPWVGIEGER